MTRTSLPFSGTTGLDSSDLALFETLLADAPFGFAFFDTQGHFRRVNQALATLDGLPVEEHIGRSCGDVLAPRLAEPVEEALRVVVEQDRTLSNREFSVEFPPDSGQWRHWLSNWVPARDEDGQIVGVVLLAVEVTEQLRSQEELQRSWERYRSLAQASEQVVWVASPEGKIYEESQEWHAITGQEFAEYAGDGWLDAIHPDDRASVQQAWRRALQTGSTFQCEYRLQIRSGEYRNYTSRAIPIVRDGEIVEWIGASADVTANHDAEEMRERLNQQLSAAALRTARLQQVTSMLAEVLTVDAVARTIVEVGSSAIGAHRTAVALYNRQRERLEVEGDDTPDLPGESRRTLSLTAPTVLSRAVRDREVFVASSPEQLRKQLPSPEIDEFLEQTDERAWIGLPLLTSGDPIGAVRFSFTRSRRFFPDEERTFLQAVAGQCALAVERATFYEREHANADTLQHSLLPGELPQPPGLLLAAHYQPAGSGLRVGGDWYDAFEVADGRLAVVVGDVMGKGVRAAAGMGRVRSALRALALSDPQPTAVLTGLDSLFAATEEAEQVTTVLYSLLDTATGDVLVGNAGHPPPLVLSPGGRPQLAPYEPGRPLGAPTALDGEEGRIQQQYRLKPGETAVAFSDGLVENRGRGVHEGLEELVEVAAAAPCDVASDPQSLLDYLFRRMLTDYDQDDDVTLLATHVRPVGD